MNRKTGLVVSSIIVSVALLVSPAVGFAQDVSWKRSPENSVALAAGGHLDSVDAISVSADELNEATDFDAAIATLTRYLVFEEGGQPRFDVARAEADDASEYLLAAGDDFNRFGDAQGEETDGLLRASMPGYGNWCGPGRSGPGAPINTLDSLCQRHDHCYGARGYFACSCDRELLQGIRDNRGKFNGFGENAMALAVATWFNSAVCNPLK